MRASLAAWGTRASSDGERAARRSGVWGAGSKPEGAPRGAGPDGAQRIADTCSCAGARRPPTPPTPTPTPTHPLHALQPRAALHLERRGGRDHASREQLLASGAAQLGAQRGVLLVVVPPRALGLGARATKVASESGRERRLRVPERGPAAARQHAAVALRSPVVLLPKAAGRCRGGARRQRQAQSRLREPQRWWRRPDLRARAAHRRHLAQRLRAAPGQRVAGATRVRGAEDGGRVTTTGGRAPRAYSRRRTLARAASFQPASM